MSAKNYTKNRIQAIKMYKDRGSIKFIGVMHFWLWIVMFVFLFPFYSPINPINEDTVNLWERPWFYVFVRFWCIDFQFLTEFISRKKINPSYSLMRANPNMYVMNAFRYWWTSFSTFYWCLWTYGFESTEASNLRLSGVTLYENRDQSVHALSKELDQLLALETSKTGKS